jgi:heme exporter protein A
MDSLTSEPLLSVFQLTKTFGAVTAVRNVDLEVYRGDFLAILGPNGAGKTTLLKLVASLTPPTSGSFRFCMERRGKIRNYIGFVSHQSLLYKDLTGLENLVFFAQLYGVTSPRERALDILEKMGLAVAGHQFVREYSSGMRQRLTLARALIHEPEILLLDEPYNGLDQHGSRVLREILQRLKREGRTILLITHNLLEGLALSSRLLVMNRGQIVHRADRADVDEEDFEDLYFRLIEES